MTIKLWCYEDAHNWGQNLSVAATKRGHDVHLFDDPREPDEGYVMMHMHHHPQVRLLHKRVMAIMAMNPRLTLVPDYRSSILYDDKLEQARQLSRWMPRTHVFYTPAAARRFLETSPNYPFVSKASEGASSHNVRMIATNDDARMEIKHAFSDIGIKCRYGQTQRGYLLWQEFMPGNDGDIRIAAIGKKRLILRRGNRDDKPLQGGSGKLKVITGELDHDCAQALAMSNMFFAHENMNWCGIDVVKDARGKWHVLETTVGWSLHAYYECEFYDTLGKPQGIMGDKVWDVLLDEIEAGVFDGPLL